MATLVLADHDNHSLSEQTARAVTAATEIDAKVHVLVAGHDCGDAAAAASRLSGVDAVLRADADAFSGHLAEPVAALILALAPDYETFVAPATSLGKSVMPRVAALLDVPQASEIIAVLAPDTFKRTAFAGNVVQTVQLPDTKKVLTVRTTSFAPASPSGNAVVTPVNVNVEAGPSAFVSNAIATTNRPDLTSAKIVVSGGRAVGSPEQFRDLIVPFADKIGGAVGASRAAVDAGYAPNDWQVGQTGKIVAPDVYFAFGISGAIQHLAGMKDSKVIVAINKDADAPIFQVADYGLVADIFEAVPALSAAL